MLSSLILTLSLCAIAFNVEGAVTTPHESLVSVPSGFSDHGPAPSNTTLDLRFALRPNNISGLETVLYDVSNPESSNYGKHLSRQEVEAYATPSGETTKAFQAWLTSNDLAASPITPAGDWYHIAIPVKQANDVLAANFSIFNHDASGQSVVRTLAYSIPAGLGDHVDLVFPTVSFPSSNLEKRQSLIHSPPSDVANPTSTGSTLPDSCQNVTTPTCVLDLYSIPTTLATQSSNSLYVSGFQSEWVNQPDLQQFLEANRPDLNSSTTFGFVSVNGGTNNQTVDVAGFESSLDIDYTVGIASGVPVTFLAVGPSFGAFTDLLLNETAYLLSLDEVPNVLTTSYGFAERQLLLPTVIAICNQYMQLAARGLSIIYSSGDDGVGGDCFYNNTFLPDFPASCPYVTAVGATQLNGGSTEIAAGFSGGGFSDVFAAPSYQTADTSAFIQSLGSEYAGLYNVSGRGIPDVSALGVNFTEVCENKTVLNTGTSASAPVFASVVALLNDQLIAAGKSPLGFLNPFLYSATGRAAFTDITSGQNPGCDTDGFTATTGWDPVTGLGTPNFAKLKSAVGL